MCEHTENHLNGSEFFDNGVKMIAWWCRDCGEELYREPRK